MNRSIGKPPLVAAAAGLFTVAVVALGYLLLGLWPALLFCFGYVGGLALWLAAPARPTFADIRIPYFTALGLFAVHKAEERYLDFFPALSRLTGVPMPDTGSILVFALYAFAGAWLLIPWLVGRGSAFGVFLAWTFFASMGLTELAHFAFPFLAGGPLGYFPGLASAALLAPAGWWGLWALARSRREVSA